MLGLLVTWIPKGNSAHLWPLREQHVNQADRPLCSSKENFIQIAGCHHGNCKNDATVNDPWRLPSSLTMLMCAFLPYICGKVFLNCLVKLYNSN